MTPERLSDPIETKTDSEGKLRSLHQFISKKPWKLVVHFNTGVVQRDCIKLKASVASQNDYELISLSFYLLVRYTDYQTIARRGNEVKLY